MKILIIGTGVIGSGFARNLKDGNQLFLYDHDKEKLNHLAQETASEVISSIEEGIKQAELILLCVKPQNLKEISKLLIGKIQNSQILISVLSGTSKKVLEAHLGKIPLLRLMPNIPCFYGKGILTFSIDETIPQNKKNEIEKLFNPLGKIFWVEESKFDAMTALAGSGPAFVYILIESMVDAGIALGISAEKSKEIALQMFQGALAVLEKSGKHPGELKWEVTSPGGCTIAGIQMLENESLRSSFINVFLATYEHLIEE